MPPIGYSYLFIHILCNFFKDPRRGKRKPSRWFEPIEKNNFEQELPAEWEGM